MQPHEQARWVLAPAAQNPAQDRAQALAAELACPQAIATLLLSRNILTPQAADRFFAPSLDDLHDPFLLLGMHTAVARIRQAVEADEPMLIYGDYDVDGTIAIVLLKTAIERIAAPGLPARVSYHVPHRLREGYGMQTARLAEAAAAGVRLVISVDTGIRAFAAAEEARTLGLDLIVTDHHLPDGAEGVPQAVAVVNPAQHGCPYPNKDLCGAGVAFKLAHALLLSHAATDRERERLTAVLLPSLLKLVAIATIADAVALTGENRAIAWLGLRALANPVQHGLRALMQVAKLALDAPPTASEVGFRLGPRINAAGRMDVASDVVELFLTRDNGRAHELAARLDRLNEERRATEAAALEAIELQLAGLRDQAGRYAAQCFVLDHSEWHRGVLGILASRVVDRTGRPALVLSSEGEAAHGSGRSIAGFHLLDALTSIHAPALFHRFGGHAHAVGFSLPTASLVTLRERMAAHTAVHLREELLVPTIACDAELHAENLSLDLLAWLDRAAPYGMGHAEPVFAVRSLVLAGALRVIKQRHVCLPLVSAPGLPALNAMGWSRDGRIPWPERLAALELEQGSRIDVAARLRLNRHPQYGGVELELIDLRPASAPTI